MSAHQHLRAATRAAHDRVDARFSTFDLANAKQYGEFLLIHAAAFIPAEQAIADAGGECIPAFQDHRRSEALRQDLADLQLEVPVLQKAAPLTNWPEVLGSAYVLEGSRLGGTVLARQIGANLPRRFLGASSAGGHWRAFVAYLDFHLADEHAIADATRSALETFALFETETIGVRA